MKRFVLLMSILIASGCSSSEQYCARQAECSDDKVESDEVAICKASLEGNLKTLRANKEKDCHTLAAAIERYNVCRAGLACTDLQENKACGNEKSELRDACDSVDDECEGSFLVWLCYGLGDTGDS